VEFYPRDAARVGESNERQSSLLRGAGYDVHLSVTLADGRRCRVFGA